MANKIEHLEVIADHIERNIGGFSNVATLTHCIHNAFNSIYVT